MCREDTLYRLVAPEGARRFERYTSANIGNRLAIVLDNTVISAPTVSRPGGRVFLILILSSYPTARMAWPPSTFSPLTGKGISPLLSAWLIEL